MKKLTQKLGIILFGLTILFNSCDEMEELGIEIDSPETTVEFMIAPIDEVGYQVIGSTSFTANMDSLLDANGFGTEDIGSIVIKKMNLEIVSSSPDANATFDELETIDFNISTDILEEVSLAYIDSIPEGARSINCQKTGMDYKDYVLADEYNLLIAGSNKAPITNLMVVKGTFQFTIKILLSSVTEATEE